MSWKLIAVVFWAAVLPQPNSAIDVTALEGTTLNMVCDAPAMREGSILWKKNNELIALDEDVLDMEGGYSVMIEGGNSTLIISRVEPINSADYTCELTDPKKDTTVELRKYRIQVHAPPVIIISPELSVYNVRIDDKNIVLQCYIKEGNPTPTVQWTRQDGRLPPDVRKENNGAKLVIPKAAREHSGKYSCEARNIAGSVKTVVELVVDESPADAPVEAPWVRTEVSFIPTERLVDVNVSCTYDGTPVPIVEWFFNGYKLNFSEDRFKKTKEYAQRLNGYSKTTLSVGAIDMDAFGDYACRVSNKLGSARAVVHVSGMPGPPVFSLNAPELSWTVQAYSKVLEYRLCYRLEKEDTWQDDNCKSIRVSKNDNRGDDKWEHTVLLDFLKPGKKYELQLKARNSLGWGSYAKDYLTVEIPHTTETETKSATTLSVFLAFVFVLAVVCCQ